MARPFGAVNKATTAVRDRVKLLFDRYTADQMWEDMQKVSEKDRLLIFAHLAEFIAPKLQRSEIEQTNNTELIVRVIRDRVGLQRHQPPALTSGSGDGDSTGETV